jgi:cysteine desulfurase
MTRRVYLDNNATTPVLPEVLEAMRPYFGERFGNASSIHHHGQETRAAVERARESVAGLLGCRASEIVFTGGGTEADNLAIFGIAHVGDHVISSTIMRSSMPASIWRQTDSKSRTFRWMAAAGWIRRM